VASQVHTGWEGLNHRDQRLASNGNQFSAEPPDQGLCVGDVNGVTYVVESVNDALTVFDAQGDQYIAPVALNQFYGLAPSLNRTTGRFGPFVTDPQCYFDPDTGHWFHTAAVLSLNPRTGAFTNKYAYTALAVSKTSDPLGAYYRYRINAKDANHPGCPCFGDQPLIGADKYGFYINTAEYSILGPAFNGPQIYALDKRALESGRLPTVVHISNITPQTPRDPGATTGTVIPAKSPNANYDTSAGGTEYFMSSFECKLLDCSLFPVGHAFHTISVWALTNTSSLTHKRPDINLQRQDLPSERFAQSPEMTQKNGFRPLGQSVGAPINGLDTDEPHPTQVVFAAGKLWTGLNTAVAPGPRSGVAYFIARPSISGGRLGASIAKQGYVSAQNANVAYPSIGVNDAGVGVMALSLSGPTYYPSAAYIHVTSAGVSGAVIIAQRGFRPEDGFTCYKALVGPTDSCRWGDYSASIAAPNGTIWSGVEFIGNDPRTVLANWSTFIWPIRP
jgi:hypothetical protein